MHFYSTIVLGSLLVTGLASTFPSVENRAEKLQQPNSVQQYLLANNSCTSGATKSPPPGCGRRE
ncbi:MAG TPA: hypothetical protein V6D14_14390 [Coleofasciculaceae cyanobacterium]|jgi:hypothetical protein